jgi:hypothetical protein
MKGGLLNKQIQRLNRGGYRWIVCDRFGQVMSQGHSVTWRQARTDSKASEDSIAPKLRSGEFAVREKGQSSFNHYSR